MFRTHQTEAVIRTYKNLENATLPKAYLASFTLMEKNRTKVYHTKKEDFQLCAPWGHKESWKKYLFTYSSIYLYIFIPSQSLPKN